MTTKHPLIGQYVYGYIYGEGMGKSIFAFHKIINVDDDFITFANAKILLKNNKWILSGEIGTKIYKTRLVYAKKGTKAKKDKNKLFENAINNLNLKIYQNGMFDLTSPTWVAVDDFVLEG